MPTPNSTACSPARWPCGRWQADPTFSRSTCLRTRVARPGVPGSGGRHWILSMKRSPRPPLVMLGTMRRVRRSYTLNAPGSCSCWGARLRCRQLLNTATRVEARARAVGGVAGQFAADHERGEMLREIATGLLPEPDCSRSAPGWCRPRPGQVRFRGDDIAAGYRDLAPHDRPAPGARLVDCRRDGLPRRAQQHCLVRPGVRVGQDRKPLPRLRRATTRG
jgi:hypothetical protein